MTTNADWLRDAAERSRKGRLKAEDADRLERMSVELAKLGRMKVRIHQPQKPTKYEATALRWLIEGE